MYDEAKILMAGGGNPPTATAEVIDLAAATPTWKATGSMAFARRHTTAVVLADGKVLVVNGSSSPGNDAAKAVLAAELWNPGTGKWSTLASMTIKRLYHSTAMLLPDARVLVAGGGRPSATHGGADNANAEIFYRPICSKVPARRSPRPRPASPMGARSGADTRCGHDRQGAAGPARLGNAHGGLSRTFAAPFGFFFLGLSPGLMLPPARGGAADQSKRGHTSGV